jgi:gas vesicle protein
VQPESRNLMRGILVGGIVGAAAGLLLAPGPGQQTRQKVRGSAERVGRSVQGAATRSKDFVTIKSARVKEALQKQQAPGTEESVAEAGVVSEVG